MRHTLRIVSAAALVATLVASACGGSSPSGPSAGTSTLNLRLTDSPFTDAKAVLVTFAEVRAHRSEGDWTTVPFAGAATTRTCDLKKLETAEDILGSGPMPAGRYTMVRLVVTSATLYFENPSTSTACAASIPVPAGTSATVDIPSGEVKLNRGFELSAEAPTTILLDFDGDRSIHLTGNGRYTMSPVVGIVSVN